MPQPQIEVLYNYESTSSRGHSVIVQPGEQYLLVSDTNDNWWYVAKNDELDDGFYLPRTYVRRTAVDDVSTFKPRLPSTGDYRSETQRHSELFSSDGYQLLTTSTEHQCHARAAQSSFRRSKTPGFKLADPQRISRSIPVDLNFVHNIPELISAQQLVDGRMRLSDGQGPGASDTIRSLDADGLPVSGDAQDDSIYSDTSLDYTQPQSPPLTPEPESLQVDDRLNNHIYENLRADLSQSEMPEPSDEDQPLRVLHDGWAEYLEPTVGRSYFYHRPTGFSSWKPPRNLISAKEVAALLSSSDDLDSSASVDDLQKSQASDGSAFDQSETAPPPQSPTAVLCGSPPSERAPTLPAVNDAKLMTESVDSGLGRTTLSLRNKTYGLRIENRASSYDVYSCSEDLANVAATSPTGSNQGSPQSAKGIRRLESQSFVSFQHKSIKRGSLEKCKYMEAGKKIKKQWVACYVYLTSAHMIFYKDEKSSEKRGNHYAAPLGVCDLRGSAITWLESEKKKRKHVFQLELIDGTVYLFHAASSQEVNGWYHAVRQVITALPKPDFYPTPVIEQNSARRSLLLARRSSGGSNSTPHKKSLSPDRNRKEKDKRKSTVIQQQPPTQSSMEQCDPQLLQKETILERLRNFFRSRPSVESLKEKGIYRPERVFGSSIIEICDQEKSSIPRFIIVCTEVIEERGLDADGLYRISGNLSQIQKIRCQVDQDKYGLLLGEGDVHVLSGSLKLFFRELQEPLFPRSTTKEFLNAIKLQNAKQRARQFRELLQRMPQPHFDTLQHLVRHLVKVSHHSVKNRMQMHNLAIVFGPTLFETCGDRKTSNATKSNNKNKKNGPAASVATTTDSIQSNSHLAFNMIMQGQIVEYLLKENERFFRPSSQVS